MKSHILDSNVLIDYLNGNQEVILYINRFSLPTLKISALSKIELLSFTKLTDKEISNIIEFLNSFEVININDDIILKSAEIRRKNKIKLPDAIIAATAITTKSNLLTRDINFKKIEELDFTNPILSS